MTTHIQQKISTKRCDGKGAQFNPVLLHPFITDTYRDVFMFGIVSFQKYIFDIEAAIHNACNPDMNRPLRMEPIQCFHAPHS